MNHPFLRMSMTSFFILISRQIFLGPITDQTPASKTVLYASKKSSHSLHTN